MSGARGTNTRTSSRTNATEKQLAQIKRGYVLYDSPRMKKLSEYTTITEKDGTPKIIKDCPECDASNSVEVTLVEQTEPGVRAKAQYKAVGELCTNENCNHSRPK